MTPPDSPVRPEPNSDSLLVQRCVDGDKRAFDLLVIKYQRRVERLIGRMVRDVDLVPDIAQETFVRAYRALAQFRGDAQFYTWLYRIAVNTAKKQLLELKRDPLVFQSQLQSGDDDETSSSERELNSNVADSETPEAVLALPEETLRAAGLSGNKAASVRDLAQKVLDGDVELDRVARLSDDEIVAAFTR
jgi:RNA polymerase sigma-70 factor (ECF subfamily)